MTNECRDQVYALAAQYGRMLARQREGDIQENDDVIDARMHATVIALGAVGREDIARKMEAISNAAQWHERGMITEYEYTTQFDRIVNRDYAHIA